MKKYFMVVAFLIILIHSNHGYSNPILEENPNEIIMQNSWIKVKISKATGGILAIYYMRSTVAKNLLTDTAYITIRDKRETVEYYQSDGKASLISTASYPPDSVRTVFDINFGLPLPPEYSYTVRIVYTLGVQAFHWDAELHLGIPDVPDREANIDFSIPVIADMGYALWSRSDTPFKLPIRRTVVYRRKEQLYYYPVAIPAVVFYNDYSDIGLSFVSPFDIKKPGLEWQMKDSSFIISNYYLRLSQYHPAHTALYIIPHEGDWRPGFGWLYDKYSAYFDPICDTVLQGEGWHKIISPWADISIIDSLSFRGVTWVELHGHFPFYGLYAPPDKDSWMIIIDKNDISYNDCLKYFYDRVLRTSYVKNNNLINFCRGTGLQNYIYFQPSESWKRYIQEGPNPSFKECIAIGPNNDTLPAWIYCYLMNPDPELTPDKLPYDSCWGMYIISQLDSILKKYPKINGLFYDRPDYCDYDFAHNDSVTMIDSHPAYMLGFAQEKIRDSILNKLHPYKGAWANWPTNIEVCKGMDGILSEDVRVAPYLQYLGINRPLILHLMWPGDYYPELTEEKLKTALYTGHFPSATYGDTNETCLDLDKRYRPLFASYKGKKWVLYPRALQLSEGIKGNIFQTPDTDYLVPMVDPDKFSTKLYPESMPAPFRYDRWGIVRVPDSMDIQYCYFLSGDYKGINQDTVYTNNSIEKRTHAHRVSSLIQLTKKPEYEITRISSPVLVRGDSEEFVIKVHNIYEEPKEYEVQLVAPFGNRDTSFHLDPGQSENVGLDFEVAENHPLVETTMTVIVNDSTIIFTSWIADFLQFDLPDSLLFIHYIQGETIPFTLINNTDDIVNVTLSGEFLEGAGKIGFPNTSQPSKDTILKPLEAKDLKVFIKSDNEVGKVKIIAKTERGNIVTIRPVERIMTPKSNDLFHDNFSSGFKKKWEIVEGLWDISGGVARGCDTGHVALSKPVSGKDWIDYKIQVNTKLEGSTDPSIDWYESFIFFRVRDTLNYYRFGIYGVYGPYNGIVLGKLKDGVWTQLADTPFDVKKNVMYNLRVEVKGDSIKGFLDGNQVISVKDNTFSSGIIGIGVPWSSMVTYYDDVVVRELQH